MEFDKLIIERRSIRKYAPADEMSKEELEKIIKSAQLAPSWKNSETGKYYAVLSPENRKEFSEKCLPEFNRNNTENSLCYIVTTFVRNIAGFSPDGKAVTECQNKWGAYDLGCQASYLILAIKNEGYDSLIMGIRNSDAIREYFNIPNDEEIMAVIAVGKRAIEPKLPRRKDLDEILQIK